MRKFLIIAITITVCYFQAISQSTPAHKVDSLRLEKLKKDLSVSKGTNKVDLLNEIAARMNFVISKSKRKDSISIYASKAYDEANKIGYQAGVAMALLNLSYESIQNPADSIKTSNEKNIRKALQIGEELKNNDVLGYGYYLLTGIPSEAHSFEKVSEYYKLSSEYCLKAGDTVRAAEVTNWLFDLYFYRGKYEEAFDIGKKAVSLSQKINDRDISRSWQQFLVQYSFGNMSYLYSVAGDYETAMNYLKQDNQYAIKYETGWLRYGNIAELFCQMGKHDSALVYWNHWRNSPGWKYSADGHKAWGNGILGEIYIAQKKYDEAIDIFKSNMEGAKKSTNTYARARELERLGEAYNAMENYETALQYARQSLIIMEEGKFADLLMKGYKLISSAYHHSGNNDSAYKYLIKYYMLKDSSLNKQFLLRLYNSKKEIEEDRKTSQINLLNKDNQLKEQKLKQEATVKKGLIAGLSLLLLLGLFVIRTLIMKKKNELVRQQLENDKKQAELQQRATELEMQALRAQMNPHFIFNCLSSINKFILKNDTDTASDYLTRFSRLIRQSLTNSQLSLIPLSDEIEMLRLYLDMERLRFSESFIYNITYENSIEPETVYVPPMLLQPFCENAIWHGLMHKEGTGKLEVILSQENGQLRCIIADNGIGRTKAAEWKSKSNGKQKSLGLKITTERLALFNDQRSTQDFYRTEDVLDADGNVSGTKVVLNVKLKNTIYQSAKETV